MSITVITEQELDNISDILRSGSGFETTGEFGWNYANIKDLIKIILPELGIEYEYQLNDGVTNEH